MEMLLVLLLVLGFCVWALFQPWFWALVALICWGAFIVSLLTLNIVSAAAALFVAMFLSSLMGWEF